MNIDEKKLRRIVNESIEEMLNAPGRDVNGKGDGEYYYTGIGTPESDERMEKISKKRWDRDRNESFFNRHGGDSPYGRMDKENGKYKNVTSDNAGGEFWYMFILYLRNAASRNYGGGKFDTYGIERYLQALKTKEGAAEFIKYLYMNGFDPQSR